MKEIALQVARDAKSQKLNLLREYLQNYLLFLMQKVGINTELYFVGGTALRFLYRIRRYSEDLDFSAGEGWRKSDFPICIKRIKAELEKAGYVLDIHLKEEKTVQRAVARFGDLLHEAGLSQQRAQHLNIALEVDTNPAPGWSGARTIVDLHLPVLLQHYDLPSLFASKLAAVLTRPYTKGRDIYDLFWYRTKWQGLEPSFRLLNNALAQATRSFEFGQVTPDNWLEVFSRKIKSLRWIDIEDDIKPFLESLDDLVVFTKENLLTALQKANSFSS